MAAKKSKKNIKAVSKGLQGIQAAKFKLPPYVKLRTKNPPKS
jgi:hypothetical protein